jgi:hypothetical protein
MAARKPQTSRRRSDDIDDGYEFDQADLDFLDFMEAIDHSVSVVEILQMNKDGSRPHVDRVTIDVIRDDVYGYLRQTWGPGKYLLIFKNAARKITNNRVVEVGGKPPAATPSNNGNSTSTETFLREQQAQQQTLILALIGAMKPPDLSFLANVLKPPDTTAMFTAIAGAVGTLRGKPDNEDWLVKAKTIIELAQDLRPDGGKDDNPWTVAREVGGRLIEAVAGGAVAAPAAVPARVLPPSTAVNPPAAPAQPGGPQMLTPEQSRAALFEGLAYLKQKATRGSDPEHYVEHIMDNEDTFPWCAVMIGAVEQGATFEQLLSLDPEIGNSPQLSAWFRKLFDELRTEIFNNGDSGRQTGHSADPGGNAPAGPEGPGRPGNS